jgi:hypothetical protein
MPLLLEAWRVAVFKAWALIAVASSASMGRPEIGRRLEELGPRSSAIAGCQWDGRGAHSNVIAAAVAGVAGRSAGHAGERRGRAGER